MNVDDVSFLIINNESDRILYNSFKDKSLSPQVIQYANDSSCVLKIGGKKTRILTVIPHLILLFSVLDGDRPF